MELKTLSISQYVNPDSQEVLFLKIAGDHSSLKDVLKGYIKKEGSWDEIKTDSNQELNEQAKLME